MARWHRLGVAVGITVLVGCGNPTPDQPVSRPTRGPADAVVSAPAGDQARAGLAGASPAAERTTDEQAQREARHSWYAEVREHPDVIVRLEALEFWAQQPGDALDPVTYALVDGDERVRTRAQELWEQRLTREAAITRP